MAAENRALPRSFYARPTLTVARALLGCVLVRPLNGQRLAGRLYGPGRHLDDISITAAPPSSHRPSFCFAHRAFSSRIVATRGHQPPADPFCYRHADGIADEVPSVADSCARQVEARFGPT